MENASKALIIAGAILISILLIGVGIIVMNAINDPVARAGDASKSQAIEIFNAKFTAYTGEVKGSALRSVISTINSSNGTDSEHKVSLRSNITGQNATQVTSSDIKSNKTYVVDVNYSSDTKPTYTGSRVAGDGGPGTTTGTSEPGYIYELVITAVK